MQEAQLKVDWTTYATQYDMLMSYNPFYQDLHEEVWGFTDQWEIGKGDVIADFGAGTGNYSCALAKKFPEAKIWHFDRDAGMNEVATSKKTKSNLANLEIIEQDSLSLDLAESSLKACISVHALYPLSNPQGLLAKIYDWLAPNGYAIFVDPQQKINVLDWQIAVATRLLSQYGFRKTLKIIREASVVSKQNREIRKLQANGTYWTHKHEEFCQSISEVGFTIVDSGLTFRKKSEWVIDRTLH